MGSAAIRGGRNRAIGPLVMLLQLRLQREVRRALLAAGRQEGGVPAAVLVVAPLVEVDPLDPARGARDLEHALDRLRLALEAAAGADAAGLGDPDGAADGVQELARGAARARRVLVVVHRPD